MLDLYLFLLFVCSSVIQAEHLLCSAVGCLSSSEAPTVNLGARQVASDPAASIQSALLLPGDYDANTPDVSGNRAQLAAFLLQSPQLQTITGFAYRASSPGAASVSLSNTRYAPHDRIESNLTKIL